MRRLLSLAAVAVAIAGTLWTPASAAAHAAAVTQPRPVSGIAWGPCSDPSLRANDARCGYLPVPLDYSNPTGPTIQLAVSRLEHTSSNYQGVILTNPGGPGGSGLAITPFLLSRLRADGYGSTVSQYDWIGFDPRGVGSSVPAISCDPNYLGPDRPNYIPSTPQLVATWLSRSQSYAQACASHGALQTALLHNMTTVDSARDMDSIRRALGQQQINYYGFSYGTYLGEVYSTLFPARVRRLILDSSVDPRTVWYQANLNQDAPFNRNENIWFAWLAKYNSVYHLGATEADVARTFYATEAQLVFQPAGGVIGPDEWVDTFQQPAYYQVTWRRWGRAFSDWVENHDAAAAKKLIGLYHAVDDPGHDNEFAVYLAVECTDAPVPTDWNVWSADNWAIFSVAPFVTWSNAWFNAPCIYWPAPPSQPVTVTGVAVQSALVIDETLDAATPFPGSVEVRKLFPNSVLLAEPGGTTHAETPSGDSCVDGTIAAYLATGALPPRDNNAPWDKSCAPPPVPVPPGATASAGAALGSLKSPAGARVRASGHHRAGHPHREQAPGVVGR